MVHTLEVVDIFRIADGVPRSGDVLIVAGVDVVLWDGQTGGLKIHGCFDEGHDETGDHVPFDVAVEKPDACREMLVRLRFEVDKWRMKWRKCKGEDLSGLSALKRSTMLPFGRTMNVSRLIGVVGSVSL